ncbi:MAG TPA: hypothetical protein VK178_03165 [Opitutaceae bacterium]|nr:hypothetical protein [Opitutaceae bacterium]
MKKLIIVGLLAVTSVAATAATVKTSKAAPLSTPQMESIKGAGTLYIYDWHRDAFGNLGYQLVYVANTGPTGPSGYVHIGGPTPGTFYQ